MKTFNTQPLWKIPKYCSHPVWSGSNPTTPGTTSRTRIQSLELNQSAHNKPSLDITSNGYKNARSQIQTTQIHSISLQCSKCTPPPVSYDHCATSEYRAKPIVSDRKVHKHPSTQLSEPGIPRTPRITTESHL